MFENSKLGESLIKQYKSWQYPLKPYKRVITTEEFDKMGKHLLNNSWSTFVDANGHIILGNGEDEGGRCYITEEDLQKLT